MASTAKRLLTVDEFLELEFRFDEDVSPRIELDNGKISAMAGGSALHSMVQGNVFSALLVKLRGSGCRPHGPDMGVRTNDLSLRYPDVSVFCGHQNPEDAKLRYFNDPKLLVEVLSPSTRRKDEGIKLFEYRALSSLEAILYVDPEAQIVRLSTRTEAGGWQDAEVTTGREIKLATLGVILSWDEIFAQD
jgi:Uma2 family endonuclease